MSHQRRLKIPSGWGWCPRNFKHPFHGSRLHHISFQTLCGEWMDLRMRSIASGWWSNQYACLVNPRKIYIKTAQRACAFLNTGSFCEGAVLTRAQRLGTAPPLFAYTSLPVCVILSQGKFLEWDCQMRGWVHVLLSSSFLRALLEEVLKFFLLRLN